MEPVYQVTSKDNLINACPQVVMTSRDSKATDSPKMNGLAQHQIPP